MENHYWTSGVSRRRFLGATAAAGAGLAGAALIGCSSSTPATPAPAAPAGAPAAAPAAPAAPKANTLASIVGKGYAMREPDGVPKYGGTLNYASGTSTIPNLDPFSSTSAMIHQVASETYSHLVHNASAPDNRNKKSYYPDIATSWEIKDPVKWTFKIRQGVKFHNVAPVNGRVMTVEDIKYSINRSATDKSSPYRGTLAAIKSIETPDASTVVLNLHRFDAGLFGALADRMVWLIPKELVEAGLGNDLKQKQVGSGPFIFQRWEQDSRVVWKKNPDYYIKGVPFVDEMNFLQIKENASRVAALQAGQTQFAGINRPDQPQFRDKKEYITERFLTVGTWSLMMNYKDARWKDDRVRKALCLALDPDIALQVDDNPDGNWRGILSAQNGEWSLSQKELKDPKYFLKQDLQKAKQLMSAAGHPDGIASSLLYRTGFKSYEDYCQYMAEVMGKNGIANIKLVPKDSPSMRKEQDEVKYDGLVAGIDGEPSPEAFLLDYHTGGPKNGMGLSDPALDAKIDKVNSTPDDKERLEATLTLVREMLQFVYWKRNFIDNNAEDQWRAEAHNYLGPVPQQYNQSGFHYVWMDKA